MDTSCGPGRHIEGRTYWSQGRQQCRFYKLDTDKTCLGIRRISYSCNILFQLYYWMIIVDFFDTACQCADVVALHGTLTGKKLHALDLFKLIISSTCKQESEFLILTSFKS